MTPRSNADAGQKTSKKRRASRSPSPQEPTGRPHPDAAAATPSGSSKRPRIETSVPNPGETPDNVPGGSQPGPAAVAARLGLPDPCCAGCALYYKMYPGLDLQAAAKDYHTTPIPAIFQRLQAAQETFDASIAPSRNRSSRIQPINERALKNFVIKWVREQTSIASPTLNLLRSLPLQRTTFILPQGNSLKSLNLHRLPHLELAALHLVGTVKQACDQCAVHPTLFTECIALGEGHGLGEFIGGCTNCLFKKRTCDFDK
ncbi:MAG: hypothetical protein LQ341_005070 [Variospora aurantia]|nr:MAG: hypothetical protein LQ341_005070 [Variospora aurantia]